MPKTVKSVSDLVQRKSRPSAGAGLFIVHQWFPISLVLLNALLSTVAEVLLKIGATHPPALGKGKPACASHYQKQSRRLGFDGGSLWIANAGSNTVSRMSISDDQMTSLIQKNTFALKM